MTFDIGEYFRRIEYFGPASVSAETLRAVHLAHSTGIPFENLDIHLGRGIRIDLESVYQKLVIDRRGGYCFEHNTLFAHALRAMGFDVRTLGARVGTGDPALLRRTHMILSVTLDGRDYLADVGFGSGTLFEPIPIEPGPEHEQHGRTYRVAENERGFVLQQRDNEQWQDMYHFTLEEMFEPDYVLANWFTSTHPDSGFVRVLTAQRRTTEVQWVLRGSTLTELRDGKELRSIVEDDALLGVLEKTFGLSFPTGTRFRSPVSPA